MLEVPLRKRRARFTVWYSHQASAGDDIQAGQFKDCMLRLMAHVTARKREAPLTRLGNFDLTHLMGSLSVSNYRHWLTLSARGLSRPVIVGLLNDLVPPLAGCLSKATRRRYSTGSANGRPPMKFVCYKCTNEELVARSRQCVDDSIAWLQNFRETCSREIRLRLAKSERFPGNELGYGSSTSSLAKS